MMKLGLFILAFTIVLALAQDQGSKKDLLQDSLQKEQNNEIDHGHRYHKKTGHKKQHLLGYRGEQWGLRKKEKHGRQEDDLDDVRLQHVDFEVQKEGKKERKEGKKERKEGKRKSKKERKDNKLKKEYFNNKKAKQQENKADRKSLRQEIRKAIRKGLSVEKILQAYGNKENFPTKYYNKMVNKLAKQQTP